MRHTRFKRLLLLVAGFAFAWSLILFVRQDATSYFPIKFATAVAVMMLSVWPSIVPEVRQYIYLMAACTSGSVLVLLVAGGLSTAGAIRWWTLFAASASGTVGFTLLTTRPLVTAGAVVAFVGIRLLFASTVWLWSHG